MKIGQQFYVAEIVQTVDKPVQYLFEDAPIPKAHGGCDDFIPQRRVAVDDSLRIFPNTVRRSSAADFANVFERQPTIKSGRTTSAPSSLFQRSEHRSQAPSYGFPPSIFF
jgi:hypothetical protein